MLKIQFFKKYEAVLLKEGYRKSMIYGCALKDVNKNSGISRFELSNLHKSKIIGEMLQHRAETDALKVCTGGSGVTQLLDLLVLLGVVTVQPFYGAGVPWVPVAQPLIGCGLASTAAKMIRNLFSSFSSHRFRSL